MPQNQTGASVQVCALSHEYPGSGRILNSLSLDIQLGEFVSILGPSGCGKSTLLRLLAGLEQPTSGSVQVAPADIASLRGFVFQEPRLLPWKSVLENVMLPLELKGKVGVSDHEKAMQVIERVRLTDAIHKFPAQLSGGMRMRTSVARALILEPSLLLLDEPFSALDESIRHSLQDDLRNLWQSLKMTILFVTHSIAEAVYLSDRVIIMSKSPARILRDQLLALPPERTSQLRLGEQYRSEVQKISEMISFKDEL